MASGTERVSGTLCLESAAVHHGWGVKAVPREPQVALAKGRRLTPDQAVGLEVHRLSLGPDDVDGPATSKDRTLVDCLRLLPADRALAVADSALREGMDRAHARALARDVRGQHAVRVRQRTSRDEARCHLLVLIARTGDGPPWLAR